VQVLGSLVPYVSSDCKVAAGDGPKTMSTVAHSCSDKCHHLFGM